MATIKAYTDLEQSKKLAEILPIESADMYYPNRIDIKYQGALPIEYKHGKHLLSQEIAAWSLTALLSVIPKRIKDYNVLRIDMDEDDFAICYNAIGFGVNTALPNITNKSAVDACYEMIVKLQELKL